MLALGCEIQEKLSYTHAYIRANPLEYVGMVHACTVPTYICIYLHVRVHVRSSSLHVCVHVCSSSLAHEAPSMFLQQGTVADANATTSAPVPHPLRLMKVSHHLPQHLTCCLEAKRLPEPTRSQDAQPPSKQIEAKKTFKLTGSPSKCVGWCLSCFSSLGCWTVCAGISALDSQN